MHLKESYPSALYSNNYGLKQLFTIVKGFITKALEYTAVLKLKNNLYMLLHIS